MWYLYPHTYVRTYLPDPPADARAIQVTNGKLPHVYHFDSKALVEEYVREQGLPATFFMPGFYMSNIPGGMMRPLPPDGAWTLALPAPETAPFPLFATEDTGKWIKAIVLKQQHGEDMLGRQVYAATAYLTPAEIVAQFRQTFPMAGGGGAGPAARYVRTSHDQFLEALTKGRGMPDFAALEMLENMRLMEEGGYFGGASLEGSQAILEDQLTTWEEYIRQSAAFASLK